MLLLGVFFKLHELIFCFIIGNFVTNFGILLKKCCYLLKNSYNKNVY